MQKYFFSNIYQETKDNADTIWKFERYDMIMEFKDKPVLPPPLSIFENIYILIKLAIQHCIRSYDCTCCTKIRETGKYKYFYNLL